jgi:hypothetical protein
MGALFGGAFLGRVSCVAAVVLSAAACSTSTPLGVGNGGGGQNNGTTEAEYAIALKKWQAAAPAHYRIIVAQTCECATDMQRPTRVTVRRIGGPELENIEDVVDAATLQAVGQDRRLAAKSVDGLLVLISQAMALNPQEARITYDSALGYPISINIDPVTSITGDEVVYKVTSFETLP